MKGGGGGLSWLSLLVADICILLSETQHMYINALLKYQLHQGYMFRPKTAIIRPMQNIYKVLYILTYSILTPWCKVLLEKLTGLQLVKKFPAFHGTRMFITALTSVRDLSLSWASPIQSYPHPTSCRSILILSTHLRLGLPIGPLPSGFPTNTLYTPSPHPYAPHVQPISFFSILSPANYWVRSTNHLAPRYAISSILPYIYSICFAFAWWWLFYSRNM